MAICLPCAKCGEGRFSPGCQYWDMDLSMPKFRIETQQPEKTPQRDPHHGPGKKELKYWAPKRVIRKSVANWFPKPAASSWHVTLRRPKSDLFALRPGNLARLHQGRRARSRTLNRLRLHEKGQRPDFEQSSSQASSGLRFRHAKTVRKGTDPPRRMQPQDWTSQKQVAMRRVSTSTGALSPGQGSEWVSGWDAEFTLVSCCAIEITTMAPKKQDSQTRK